MHQKIAFALCCAGILANSAMAQSTDSPPARVAVNGAPPAGAISQPAAGKIVLYRGSSIVGAGLGCPIRYKGGEIVELGRGKYAEWETAPGRYILTNKTSSVEVSVDAGETRYVRCMIKTGMLTGRADLQIVDEESFAEHRADFEKKDILLPASP